MHTYICMYIYLCIYVYVYQALNRFSVAYVINLLPNNQRQRRTSYALCHILHPVPAAHTIIFRMDSNSTS